LDAIVTQVLNQMDGTGPPALGKDKIKEIPVVVITQDQLVSLSSVL
jgi:E3 ubiquitin-protein ligase RNF115/126